MNRVVLIQVVCFVLLSGCGGDSGSTPDAGGPDAGESDASSLRDVTGSVIDAHLFVDGTIEMAPRDLSGETIAAHVPDGNGGYVVVTGSGMANGEFAIANVPEGEYLLQVGRVYRQTKSSTVDRGVNRLGRPDATFVAADTTITFNVDGLNAYAGEAISLNAPDSDATDYFIEGGLEPALLDGATSITGTHNWTTSALPGRIEASKGDLAYLTTNSTVAIGAGAVQTIAQFAEISDLTMIDGQDSTVGATLTDAVADQTVAISIDPANWTPHFADFGPVDVATPGLGMTAYINTSAQFGDLSLIELLAVDASLDSAVSGTVSYANPFPASWEVAAASSSLGLGFIDPPANTTIGISFIGGGGELEAHAADMRPTLGVVKAPEVDGNAFTGAQSSGPTPTISWTAPTLGNPNYYIVSVRQMGDRSRGLLIASIGTPTASVNIPDGVLVAGNRYFFEITAVDDDRDYDNAPGRNSSFDRASSRRPTGPLTIQ